MLEQDNTCSRWNTCTIVLLHKRRYVVKPFSCLTELTTLAKINVRLNINNKCKNKLTQHDFSNLVSYAVLHISD